MPLRHATAELRAATDPAPPFSALLARLALAGVAAGVLSGTWQLLVTERAISPALALEKARAAETGEHSVETFSRPTQLIGGFLGTVVAAVAFSLVVATVYAAVRHRVPGRTDGVRLITLTTIGFAIFALLPAVKIPGNPPAVGDPTTVGSRTAIYGAVLASGIVATVLVALLVSALHRRGTSTAAVAAAGTAAGVALVALIVLLLPDSPDAIPADVPAAVVWDFRLASLGQLAVLWASLGLAGGWLLDRLRRIPARTR
ncbi:Uncharacterized membrane protein, predicted cobalt tansporter CbtA [Modestobacter sp. DSM 44400]|uniref:CbtA family protein n=1 Tax=Modestobacter sp. DSM 44400 TaxID=1550230 RepID=UPI00089D76F7|nr:CbtA family protein [Modestobacter sp. DSM 44400]SDY49931.1 Uncharacterized membrane protein, predicted cobalt tansporter CbtA [Modestobacter sp. DSM 44400]